jgi:hypothetical protein
MVYATAENKEKINRVASLTSLRREQVVRAMNNERRRLKAAGFTDKDLELISTTGGLSKQLQDIRESLQACIDQEHCPSGAEDELQAISAMLKKVLTFRK